ncbi:hypothetical protein KY092_18180 [Natronomonas gomsonensis]|uniref:hypothetical protein n=1 Tax=Natronomonas gomsonensis TaxID=1046043 RepID=UPI0020CA5EAA|nr:hypothetical protein [Natronomonas gomsonensis]MCY4732473.1 hypothetical protein [Natronomonas gomsonensis]
MAPSDTELIDRTLFQLFLEEWIYPFLYSPVEELSDFLNSNSTIFTLIGVFGATSIYARQAASDVINSDLAQNIVVVMGFSLVIILSIVILVDLLRRINHNGTWYSFPNVGLVAFGAFYVPLIGVLTAVVVQFPTIWMPYIIMIAYLSGIMLPALVWQPIIRVSDYFDDQFGTGKLIQGVSVVIGLIFWIWVSGFLISEVNTESSAQFFTIQYAKELFLVLFLGFTILLGVFFLILLIVSFVLYLMKRLVLAVKDRQIILD